MKCQDAVLSALNHHETPIIPYHLEFTEAAKQCFINYTGWQNPDEIIGSFLHYSQYWGWPEEIPSRPGYFQDYFGVVWNRNGLDKDIGNVDCPQIRDLENHNYKMPAPDIDRFRQDMKQLVRTRNDRFTFFGFGFCMFERAWSLAGMENVLLSMVASPDQLNALLDDICEHFLILVDVALEYDIDGIYFGDDWGQQHGLIMGPAHWRKFIKPRMAKLYDRVKKKNKFVLQHSCGDCHEIFPDLIEIGLDCYQTFQPEVYDIVKMKNLYGDKISFWGGISTQQCLPRCSPLEVQSEIKRIVNIMREGGGLIIAPTHALTPDIPPENILAMLEVFKNQDRFFN